ncbi:MAG: putative quorum-sensing-regulated virulence factor [Symbiopectobacterium sp.]
MIAITTQKIPFSKCQGSVPIDLPEKYLLWFVHKDSFPNPKGQLGDLMKLTLIIKIEKLQRLVTLPKQH